MPNKMKNLSVVLLMIETIIIVLFLPNIYTEITNPPKINSWYDAVKQEKLGGLTAETAFYKLSRHGFKVVSIERTQNNGQRVVLEPPYDQGLIALFRVRIPFEYLVETDNKGFVISYGILK
jgi:hypothetical protein